MEIRQIGLKITLLDLMFLEEEQEKKKKKKNNQT